MVWLLLDLGGDWHSGEHFYLFEGYVAELTVVLRLLDQTAFLGWGYPDYYLRAGEAHLRQPHRGEAQAVGPEGGAGGEHPLAEISPQAGRPDGGGRYPDYYLVSKKLRWIIGFNHHNMVSLAGEGPCLRPFGEN